MKKISRCCAVLLSASVFAGCGNLKPGDNYMHGGLQGQSQQCSLSSLGKACGMLALIAGSSQLLEVQGDRLSVDDFELDGAIPSAGSVSILNDYSQWVAGSVNSKCFGMKVHANGSLDWARYVESLSSCKGAVLGNDSLSLVGVSNNAPVLIRLSSWGDVLEMTTTNDSICSGFCVDRALSSRNGEAFLGLYDQDSSYVLKIGSEGDLLWSKKLINGYISTLRLFDLFAAEQGIAFGGLFSLSGAKLFAGYMDSTTGDLEWSTLISDFRAYFTKLTLGTAGTVLAGGLFLDSGDKTSYGYPLFSFNQTNGNLIWSKGVNDLALSDHTLLYLYDTEESETLAVTTASDRLWFYALDSNQDVQWLKKFDRNQSDTSFAADAVSRTNISAASSDLLFQFTMDEKFIDRCTFFSDNQNFIQISDLDVSTVAHLVNVSDIPVSLVPYNASVTPVSNLSRSGYCKVLESQAPTFIPSMPSMQPSIWPSTQPSNPPSQLPLKVPSSEPSQLPTKTPSHPPTLETETTSTTVSPPADGVVAHRPMRMLSFLLLPLYRYFR